MCIKKIAQQPYLKKINSFENYFQSEKLLLIACNQRFKVFQSNTFKWKRFFFYTAQNAKMQFTNK